MTTSARAFFAGMGTTFVILAVGFGGGVMLAKNSIAPPQSSRVASIPEARVVLPTSAETVEQPISTSLTVESTSHADMSALPAILPIASNELNKSQERAGRRKAEMEKRALRTRVAKRKSAQYAARIAKYQVQSQPTQPNIMAFGEDE
jgi:hypothetical protein